MNYVNTGDRHSEGYPGTPRKDQPDYLEGDDCENGNRSAAEEAIERVKEIVGKSLDEFDEHR